MADLNTHHEGLGQLVPRAGTKYLDLAGELRSRIQDGTITHRLPSIPELCEEFETSPMTAHKALSLLQEEGVARAEVGKGTFLTRLRRKRTHTLGVVVHTLSPDATLHSQLISSFHDRAREIEETVVVKAHDGDPELELIHVRQLVEQARVDGLILWPAGTDTAPIDYLSRERIPFVVVPEPDPAVYGACSTVSADDAGATAALMKHLLASGRTRIGFVCFEESVRTAAGTARRRQYEASLREAGLKPAETLRVRGDDVQDELRGLEAVFCVTDGVACAVLSACLANGIRVPGDLLVAGYDNSFLSHALGLTSVDQNFGRIGRTAIDVLMDDIEGRRREAAHVVVGSELVVRRSTQAQAGGRTKRGGAR